MATEFLFRIFIQYFFLCRQGLKTVWLYVTRIYRHIFLNPVYKIFAKIYSYTSIFLCFQFRSYFSLLYETLFVYISSNDAHSTRPSRWKRSLSRMWWINSRRGCCLYKCSYLTQQFNGFSRWLTVLVELSGVIVLSKKETCNITALRVLSYSEEVPNWLICLCVIVTVSLKLSLASLIFDKLFNTAYYLKTK